MGAIPLAEFSSFFSSRLSFMYVKRIRSNDVTSYIWKEYVYNLSFSFSFRSYVRLF